MQKEVKFVTVETSRDYTQDHPKIKLAQCLASQGPLVRVTENTNIEGRFKIECTMEGLKLLAVSIAQQHQDKQP